MLISTPFGSTWTSLSDLPALVGDFGGVVLVVRLALAAATLRTIAEESGFADA